MTTMLQSLKFVQGSIAKKDFLPALTHFVIEHGKVRGFNGVMSLCSPIPFNIACKPEASTLIKAIANCDDTVKLGLTDAGRLSVKSGKFKAFVNCIQADTVHPLPEGSVVNLDGKAFLKGVKAVQAFIGNDASRRWAMGVLLSEGSLFATCNVVVVQYWIGLMFDRDICIPKEAIDEIIRINEAPTHLQVAQNSITIHYEGERWLRTQLYETKDWPIIALNTILDKPSNPHPIQEDLFVALNAVKPFVDKMGTIIFGQQCIYTHDSSEDGASYDVPDLIGEEGRYSLSMLELLKGTATHIDWSTYPGPCLFTGDMLRGAIIGMRK